MLKPHPFTAPGVSIRLLLFFCTVGILRTKRVHTNRARFTEAVVVALLTAISAFALVYVLAPEKFVLFSMEWAVGHNVAAGLALLVLTLLDLCAVAALVVAIVPEEPFPPALLVGYTITSIAHTAFRCIRVRFGYADEDFRRSVCLPGSVRGGVVGSGR